MRLPTAPTQARCVLAVLAALTFIGAMLLGNGTASAQTSSTAENRIRASASTAETFDRPQQDVSADQRPETTTVPAGVAAATGVAANTRMGGSSTLGGMDHATQSMLKYSQKHPEEGLFDVIGHGSPNEIAGRSAIEVAERIRGASGG